MPREISVENREKKTPCISILKNNVNQKLLPCEFIKNDNKHSPNQAMTILTFVTCLQHVLLVSMSRSAYNILFDEQQHSY